MRVLIVTTLHFFDQACDEAQQSNSPRRCRQYCLHDVIFGTPNSVVGSVILLLDFSKSLFDFGNFRFLPGQFVVSSLAFLCKFHLSGRKLVEAAPGDRQGRMASGRTLSARRLHRDQHVETRRERRCLLQQAWDL